MGLGLAHHYKKEAQIRDIAHLRLPTLIDGSDLSWPLFNGAGEVKPMLRNGVYRVILLHLHNIFFLAGRRGRSWAISAERVSRNIDMALQRTGIEKRLFRHFLGRLGRQ